MEQIKVNRKSVLRINVKDASYWLLLVFLTLPHMKPEYLARIPAVDMIFDMLRAMSFLIIVFWYVVKRKPISIIIVLTAVWRVFLVYSTFVHQGEVYNSIITSFSILCVMLLYDAAYSTSYIDKKAIFLSSQVFSFGLLVAINLMTELLYPDGMYINDTFPRAPNWFLGFYNSYTRYFIPALMFSGLYQNIADKRFEPILLATLIVISACVVFAGGQTVALVCMFIVYFFFKNRTTIFYYYNYWLLHIVFFVSFYVIKIQNLFMWLIDGLLGKLASFMTRMNLWEKTVSLIKQSPVIGYGLKDGAERIAEYNLHYGIHAHNMLLELLYEGGFVGLILWTFVVVLAGKKICKNRNTQESKIISIAFLGWCIATLVEPFTTPFFMGMFVIAHRSNRSEMDESVGGRLSEVI